jgi:hypothetical protein
MIFELDLSRITLKKYTSILKSKTMIPSRSCLLENLDEKFFVLENRGVHTLADLFQLISNENEIEIILKNRLFDTNFIKVLNREIKSYQPKAIKLVEFTWITQDLQKALLELSITNTKKLLEKIDSDDFEKLHKNNFGKNYHDFDVLVSQCSLTRIQWVNHTFARVLFESDYKSVSSVANASSDTMYNTIVSINKQKNLYRGNIGLKDILDSSIKCNF